MEDIVRTAAPYCLYATWTPEVDREMVLLQAQVTYLEAEACVAALQSQRKEVVPPLTDEGQASDDRGLRLPSQEAPHLQGLFLKVSGATGLRGCLSVFAGGIVAFLVFILCPGSVLRRIRLLSSRVDITGV